MLPCDKGASCRRVICDVRVCFTMVLMSAALSLVVAASASAEFIFYTHVYSSAIDVLYVCIELYGRTDMRAAMM